MGIIKHEEWCCNICGVIQDGNSDNIKSWAYLNLNYAPSSDGSNIITVCSKCVKMLNASYKERTELFSDE